MQTIVVPGAELDKLSALEDQAPASIKLVAKEYDHPGLEALAGALTKHGAALAELEMSLAFPRHPYTHNLRDFDFATACPNLVALSVGRCQLNETVLLHPALETVKLENCWLYTPDPLRLGYSESPASSVTELNLIDVNWGNPDEDYLSRLAFGPESPLKSLRYSLDEDASELYPEALIFDGCPNLAEVYLHVSGGWMVKFTGGLPRLSDVGLFSGRYGDHQCYVDGIGKGSSAYALRLREGQS